ncbi:DUF5305 domain-containing protein [Salinirubellus salinus]|uniref:DUF5305 domain-containing protein n=1 Tax=Salinirubellus salinus TaxID=1364945 RepID=A0A9E7R500_9EURY|nr:DUF5305 domain-containing protein [Salinirubellus salinus]UWM55314.1 DUF5305 domain-containing protein [Salinirubellus salinus]
MSGRESVRLRRAVGDRFGALVGLLLVLALVGGAFTYTTHVEPGTHVEERTVSSWESTAGYAHSATVTSENGVFGVGRTLSDRALYFDAITPTLDGELRYGYEATGEGELTVRSSSTLVVRAVGERDDREVVYWRVSEPLGRPSSSTIAPGETFTAPFGTNVSALKERVARIETELGGSPGTPEASVLTRVRVSGTVNGEQVSRSREFTMTLTLDEGGTYRVLGDEEITRTTNSTERVVVRDEYGPLRRAGAPALLALSLLGLVGLVAARSTDRLEVTEAERSRSAFERAREEFDEWITPADVDPPTDPVRVHTLEGLVDLAIDTGERVLEAPERERYYVFGQQDYVYEAPAPFADGEPGAAESTTDTDDEGDGGDDTPVEDAS